MGSKLQWKKQPAGGTSTYEGGMYCGPGWGYVRQDVTSGRIAELPEAIDAIDRACRSHDQCYQDNGYLTLKCNVRLASELLLIVADPKSTPQQRNDAYVMAAIFQLEAMTLDAAVFVPKEGYRKLHTLIVATWDKGTRTMASIIQEAHIRLCSEAAKGAAFGGADVCR